MKGVNFVKKLSMTKKKVVRNFGENRRQLFQDFGENRRQLFQDFLSENKFPQNFCPPNIYDKSTPVLVYIYASTLNTQKWTLKWRKFEVALSGRNSPKICLQLRLYSPC